jgi:hypothetical protein
MNNNNFNIVTSKLHSFIKSNSKDTARIISTTSKITNKVNNNNNNHVLKKKEGSVSVSKKKIKFTRNVYINKKKIIIPDKCPKLLIVDFYNVYCNLIIFNKYKKFTLESYLHCFNKILMENLQKKKLIIVSKIIYEVSNNTIKKLTKLHDNVIYIIVNDDNTQSGLQKERDDYVCIVINVILNKLGKSENTTSILTNDNYKNLYKILNCINNISFTVFYKGKQIKLNVNNKPLYLVIKQQIIENCNLISQNKFYIK